MAYDFGSMFRSLWFCPVAYELGGGFRSRCLLPSYDLCTIRAMPGSTTAWGDIFRNVSDHVALTPLVRFINGFVPHAAKLPRTKELLEARILGVLVARGVAKDKVRP